MIKEAIVKIVNKEDLTYDEAYAVMNEIMGGETTSTQNAAFLAALSTKSAKAETTDEIAGCAAAMNFVFFHRCDDRYTCSFKNRHCILLLSSLYALHFFLLKMLLQ